MMVSDQVVSDQGVEVQQEVSATDLWAEVCGLQIRVVTPLRNPLTLGIKMDTQVANV